MIFKEKDDILNWLKNYDKSYQNNTYELIDIHDIINQSLLNELIKKDNLLPDYFKQLKSEGHQYIVNVKGPIGCATSSVDISSHDLKDIPFQFYHVDSSFYCDNNQFKSLKGCPKYVNGDFFCHHNQITSFKYAPIFVFGSFCCHYNQLNSLEYFPENIRQEILIYGNLSLLKYKNQSHDIKIVNMSDHDFLSSYDCNFWHQFYFQEKIKKENKQIIDALNLNDKVESNDFGKHKVKKV